MLADAKVHKRALARQADITTEKVLQLYRDTVAGYLSPEHMDLFVRAALPLVKAGMAAAHNVSASAYARSRRSEGVSGRIPFPRQRTPNDEQIVSSLKYLGFVAPRRRELDQPSFEIPLTDPQPEKTESHLGGGVGRRVVQQGMDSMLAAQRADQRALGWARVTQGDNRVCYFCSMLETRGPVYKVGSFAESDPRFKSNAFPPAVLSGELGAKAHDHCRCVLAPIFTRSSDIVANADDGYATWLKVQRQYADIARMLGWDMMRVWRLWWEGRIEEEIEKALGR